jgi:hypothetical protein
VDQAGRHAVAAAVRGCVLLALRPPAPAPG